MIGGRRWVALAALLLGLAAACGSARTPVPTSAPAPAATPAPEPTLDPLTVMRRAVSRVLALESASFTLEHRKGSTLLFPGLEMLKASGVVDIPDRFRLTVEGQSAFPRSFAEIRIVAIDDQAYLTDFVTGKWQRVPPEALPFRFANLGQTLAGIIEAVEAPVIVDTERLRGYTAHRIRGRIRSQELGSLVPGAGHGFDVALELWLDQSQGLLLQVLLSGRVLPTDQSDSVRLLTLDDIDLPVSITPPL